jgi:hypothetical protein
MMQFFKKYLVVLGGILIGMVAGYLYWRFEGCRSGVCRITSNPVNSSVYGAFMGGVLFSLFITKK